MWWKLTFILFSIFIFIALCQSYKRKRLAEKVSVSSSAFDKSQVKKISAFLEWPFGKQKKERKLFNTYVQNKKVFDLQVCKFVFIISDVIGFFRDNSKHGNLYRVKILSTHNTIMSYCLKEWTLLTQ